MDPSNDGSGQDHGSRLRFFKSAMIPIQPKRDGFEEEKKQGVTTNNVQRLPAGTLSFEPPQVTKKNPLTKINNGESPGKTKVTINGKEIDDSNFANQLADIKQKITPTTIVQQPNAGGTKGCSFDASFALKTSAKISAITSPGAKGWSGHIDMTKVTPAPPRQCIGKGLVAATMKAKPTSQSYAKLVEDSEVEHVKELEILHNRHFQNRPFGSKRCT
jgi:hypothetical protein